MNGIMSRGTSPSKLSPVSDMTLGCLKESIIDTSFKSLTLSLADGRTEYIETIELHISGTFLYILYYTTTQIV